MAVIIENMKLPDSCGKCYLRCKVGSYANPVYRCSVTGSIIDYTNHVTYKCNDCPLKEVSDNSVLENIKVKIELLPTSICTETCRIRIDADDFKENVLAILNKYNVESEG